MLIGKRVVLVAGAAGVLLAAVGTAAGAAVASIPDSGGVIHACYQSPPPAGGANLQVIDTANGGKCSGGHVGLSWNQQGPQGPAGPMGPAGPQGPPGSNAVYGRITGIDFGAQFGYQGAPSGVSTASVTDLL